MLPGIHDEVVGVLRQAGYESAAQLTEAGAEGLAETGLDAETIQAVLEAASATAGAARGRTGDGRVAARPLGRRV